MKHVLIKRLVFWLGWLLLAMALASLVWSLLMWRYPLLVDSAATKISSVQVKAAWLNGLERHWLVGEQTPQRVVNNAPIQISRLAVKEIGRAHV